jgi:hypothetical protein
MNSRFNRSYFLAPAFLGSSGYVSGQAAQPAAAVACGNAALLTFEQGRRLDSTDWTVTYQDQKYRVLTDEQGCVLAATLPEYGVVIERRARFAGDEYPLWPPYSAPPDNAYRAEEVSIPAAHGAALASTLTLPFRKGRVPAIVIVTGLSPHERNNGDAPWMPFRDIADALTRPGLRSCAWMIAASASQPGIAASGPPLTKRTTCARRLRGCARNPRSTPGGLRLSDIVRAG